VSDATAAAAATAATISLFTFMAIKQWNDLPTELITTHFTTFFCLTKQNSEYSHSKGCGGCFRVGDVGMIVFVYFY